jgi:alpha-beta hydrolase superfamily lysophospholipase
MPGTAFLFALNMVHWALTIVGVAAVALGVMLAAPLRDIPMLESIARTVRTVDRSDLPAVDRFQARDGTTLGYRHYPAHQPAVPRIAVLVHGSSGSSASVHALAKALAAAGVETFAPDIRGHGVSGTRGDIDYVGQLEDDMADFFGEIGKTRPGLPLTLLGHSSGGGFALRVAASPLGARLERTVMIAPYFGYDAPTNRPDSGGWAQADVPRFIALALLGKLGFHGADALPTLALAVAPDSKKTHTGRYSYRLMRNFGTRDFRADIRAAQRPLALIAAGDDELMLSDRYAAAVGPAVAVRVIPGVNHMAVLSAPDAVAAIASDVAGYPPAAW